MKVLTAKNILEMNDIKTKKVLVNEWGGEIYIKQLNSLEWNIYKNVRFVGEGEKRKANEKNEAILVSLAVCDENGKNLFTIEDAEKLLEKNAIVIQKIAEEIIIFNFNTIENEEERIEEAKKK